MLEAFSPTTTTEDKIKTRDRQQNKILVKNESWLGGKFYGGLNNHEMADWQYSPFVHPCKGGILPHAHPNLPNIKSNDLSYEVPARAEWKKGSVMGARVEQIKVWLLSFMI